MLPFCVAVGLLASSFVYAQQQTNAVQSNNSNTTNHVNESVVDKRWNFQHLGIDERLNFDETPYFAISSDGSVSGYDGCNRFNGQAELSDNLRIEFTQLDSTRMACPDVDAAQQVADMLSDSSRYLIDDDILILFAPDTRMLGSWSHQADLVAGVTSGGTALDGIAGALGVSTTAVAVGAGIIVTGIVIGASNSGSSSGASGTN